MTNFDPLEPGHIVDQFSDLGYLPAIDAHLQGPDGEEFTDAAAGLDDGPDVDQEVAASNDIDDGRDATSDLDDLDGDLEETNDAPSEPGTSSMAFGDGDGDGDERVGPTHDPFADIGSWSTGAGVAPFEALAAEVWQVELTPFEHLIEPGDGLELRQLSASLEQHGVDAFVTHDDLDLLADRIDGGSSAIVTVDTGAGPLPMRIVEIRWDDDALVLESLDGGSAMLVDLDAFEDAWAETANQVLVTAAPETHDQGSGGPSDWVVLSVRLDAGAVLSPTPDVAQ